MKTSSGKTNATLHTVIIQTSKMEEMAAFYGEGLELGEPVPTGENHLGLPLPNAYFGFDLVDVAPEPTGVISVWFEVNDLELVFNNFEKIEAKVKYPPKLMPWGAKLAALYDPDGNLFGLSQRGAGPE